jgi:hypothetical protein
LTRTNASAEFAKDGKRTGEFTIAAIVQQHRLLLIDPARNGSGSGGDAVGSGSGGGVAAANSPPFQPTKDRIPAKPPTGPVPSFSSALHSMGVQTTPSVSAKNLATVPSVRTVQYSADDLALLDMDSAVAGNSLARDGEAAVNSFINRPSTNTTLENPSVVPLRASDYALTANLPQHVPFTPRGMSSGLQRARSSPTPSASVAAEAAAAEAAALQPFVSRARGGGGVRHYASLSWTEQTKAKELHAIVRKQPSAKDNHDHNQRKLVQSFNEELKRMKNRKYLTGKVVVIYLKPFFTEAKLSKEEWKAIVREVTSQVFRELKAKLCGITELGPMLITEAVATDISKRALQALKTMQDAKQAPEALETVQKKGGNISRPLNFDFDDYHFRWNNESNFGQFAVAKLLEEKWSEPIRKEVRVSFDEPVDRPNPNLATLEAKSASLWKSLDSPARQSSTQGKSLMQPQPEQPGGIQEQGRGPTGERGREEHEFHRTSAAPISPNVRSPFQTVLSKNVVSPTGEEVQAGQNQRRSSEPIFINEAFCSNIHSLQSQSPTVMSPTISMILSPQSTTSSDLNDFAFMEEFSRTEQGRQYLDKTADAPTRSGLQQRPRSKSDSGPQLLKSPLQPLHQVGRSNSPLHRGNHPRSSYLDDVPLSRHSAPAHSRPQPQNRGRERDLDRPRSHAQDRDHSRPRSRNRSRSRSPPQQQRWQNVNDIYAQDRDRDRPRSLAQDRDHSRPRSRNRSRSRSPPQQQRWQNVNDVYAQDLTLGTRRKRSPSPPRKQQSDGRTFKRARSRSPPSVQITCNFCLSSEHYTSECAQFKAKRPGRGYACQYCKSPEHYMLFCPSGQFNANKNGVRCPNQRTDKDGHCRYGKICVYLHT